jgi:hypothetical protein
MRHPTSRRRSPALVVALLALALALTTPAYAAVKLAKNSVGSTQIKKGAVKTSDLAKRSVTSDRIKDGAVGSTQVQDGSVGANDLEASVTEEIQAAQPVLRSGQTLRGHFLAAASTDGSSGYSGDAITFPRALPASFDPTHVEHLSAGDSPTANCPGIGQAAPGWACVYTGQSNLSTLCCIYGDGFDYNSPQVGRYGFRIYWSVVGDAPYVDGVWAVTAP